MLVQLGLVITDVPLITLEGQYIASRHLDTLIIAQLAVPIGPGNWTTEEQFKSAIPVLAIKFKDVGSIEAIRKWLDAIERSIAPRWRYKDGD